MTSRGQMLGLCRNPSITVATLPLRMKVLTVYAEVNRPSCVPIKLYLQKQTMVELSLQAMISHPLPYSPELTERVLASGDHVAGGILGQEWHKQGVMTEGQDSEQARGIL